MSVVFFLCCSQLHSHARLKINHCISMQAKRIAWASQIQTALHLQSLVILWNKARIISSFWWPVSVSAAFGEQRSTAGLRFEPPLARPTAWRQQTKDHSLFHNAGFYHRDEKDPMTETHTLAPAGSKSFLNIKVLLQSTTHPGFFHSVPVLPVGLMPQLKSESERGHLLSRRRGTSHEKSGCGPEKKTKQNKAKDSKRGREPSSKPDLLMELLLASTDFL